MEVAIGS